MAQRNKSVHMYVDPKFYDNWFEKERKKASNKFGVNFNNQRFTQFLHQSKAKLVYPVRKDTFAPKRRRGGGLSLSL